MFEILGTFIILMAMFCTDIDELFRISQEVLKQPPWKTPDTVAKMVSNSQNGWSQVISNCSPLPVALRTTHHWPQQLGQYLHPVELFKEFHVHTLRMIYGKTEYY